MEGIGFDRREGNIEVAIGDYLKISLIKTVDVPSDSPKYQLSKRCSGGDDTTS
jgi:hypothetical protein